MAHNDNKTTVGGLSVSRVGEGMAGRASGVVSAAGRRLVRLRRRLGARVVAGALESASALGRLAPQARPEAHGLERFVDLPYLTSGLPEHRLDVYRPRGARGLPVVFYVHGGAFRSLSKDTHWMMGLAFARRGFVVAMPNHRLAPAHRFPAALDDLAEALRFVQAQAPAWGGDPSKIIFAGESAGANLVTSLSLCISYERQEPCARVVRSLGVEPLAVLAACGVFEVTNGRRFLEKHRLHWFLQDRYLELEENYPPQREGRPVAHDLINPLLLLEREAPRRPLPPFFLPVGSRDHLMDDHTRMAAALRRHGVDVEAPVYDGEVHAFHAFVLGDQARRCWQDHFAFLHARGVPARLTV